MRATVVTPIVGALAVLSGCGSSTARLPDPTATEAVEGVLRLLKATQVSAKVTVPKGQPTHCARGTHGTAEVRTCKVCAMTLYTANQMFGSWTASLRLEIFDVAFKRGQSFEQPDVTPLDAKSGVWTAVLPVQTSQFAPPDVPRKVVISQNLDYEVAANLLEITHKKGNFGSHLFWDANGSVPSSEVPQRLKNLPNDRLWPLVGECPATV